MEPTTAQPSDPALVAAPPDPGLVARVQSVVPAVQWVVGKVRAVGVVSAIAGLVLWAILFAEAVWPLSAETLVAVLGLVVLLLPAAGTFLAVLTFREVLTLPARLKALPGKLSSTVGDLTDEATTVAGSAAGGRGKRALGFFGLLWKLRGIVEDTRGSWLRTLALARFARLASLPFFLYLLGAFALNFVVIAAAAIAVLVVAVF